MSQIHEGSPISLSQLWDDMYFGNGKPGITTRVALVEDAVGRIERKLDLHNKIVITAICALAVDIIVRLIK